MLTESMLVLSLDTSTLLGSVGWVEVDKHDEGEASPAFAESISSASPGHAETLLTRIKTILSFGGHSIRDIGLIVFGRGPGTFTGLRIGLSTAKGIALAGQIPILGISSLEALALSSDRDGLVATLIDARRRELFGALYDVKHSEGWPSAQPLLQERVGPAAQVLDEISSLAGDRTVCVTGNGIAPYREQIIENFAQRGAILPEHSWAPSAVWMARIGHRRFVQNGPDSLDTLEPVYLREPDARLPSDKGALKKPNRQKRSGGNQSF